MTEEIQYTVVWKIKSGGLDAFKELAKKATSLVQKNEPDMKGYQWYFNDNETICYTAEWHSNSDSLLAHLANVGDVLPQLLGYSDITRFEVFGNPSPKVSEALNGLGAVFNGFFDGFTR